MIKNYDTHVCVAYKAWQADLMTEYKTIINVTPRIRDQ
jgi:hypothetical protein